MQNFGCNYSDNQTQNLSCDRSNTNCIKYAFNSQLLAVNLPIKPHAFIPPNSPTNSSRKKHLVCIDPRVENYQHLASGVLPETEVIVLDVATDGVEQITRILADRTAISSLQIVTHGRPAWVQLGSTALTVQNLQKYDRQLQQWRHSLDRSADILLLACRVGASKYGKDFLRQLRKLTGANIGASNNLIGDRKLGGNWQLNVTAGQVKNAIAFTSQTLATYSSVLATLVDETFQNASLVGPWIFGVSGTSQSPALTSGTGSGVFPGLNIDDPGSGALRLTSNQGNQSTFVIYNNAIPATSGIKIIFDIFAYGGTSPFVNNPTGDGTSFFLIDGTATPTQAGGYGGSLGYAQNSDTNTPGLVGGYLGIGFDEFGNFSNPTQGRVGGIPGTIKDSVTLRGREATGYQFLTSTILPGGVDNIRDIVNPLPPNGPINLITSNREQARRRVQIILQPPTSATPNRLTVNFDIDNNGSFTDPGETIIDIPNLANANGPVPPTFKFGFASSTGDATNIHDVRTLSIETIDTPLTQADIATTKIGPTIAAAGSSITYTITTRNNGPNPAQNIIIQDRLPTGATFSSAEGGGSFNPTTRVVTWPTVATLAVGESVTRTLTVAVPTTLGSITNIAYSSSTTIDPIPANNSGSTPGSQVTTAISQNTANADVVIAKTGPAAATVGSTVTYTITASNSGPSPAANVAITDSLIPGLTGVSASNNGTYNPVTGIVTFPAIVELASATSASRTVSVTVPASITLTNTARSTSDTADPTPGNNNGSGPSSTVTTTFTTSADVATVKTGPASAAPGSIATYTITSTNSGPSPAANVAIADSIIPGLTGVSVSDGGTYNSATGIVTWPAIASLASAASATRTVSLTVPATGTIANTARNTSDTPDPLPGNNNGSNPASTVTTSVASNADLVTTKTGPATTTPGSTVTYTILTQNLGPNTAASVTVTDSIIPGLTGVTASNGGTYDPATGIVTFPAVADLPEGLAVVRTVSFRMPVTGTVSNTARSTAITADPNPANNNGSVPTATVATNIVPPPTPTPPNQPPVANNANAIVAPSGTVAIAGLGGTDPDGTIAFFTITSVPPAAQGAVFLGNPSAGGTGVSIGQTLTPAQIGQIFFQSAAGFTGTNFTYTATDNRGAASPATATVAVLLPPPNLPPVVANVNLAIPPSNIAPIAGLGATDPDGAIASFTINTVPVATQGIIFLGNPATGGIGVTAGQTLTPTQIGQLFFQSTSGFTGANFSYSATDNLGAIAPASATVAAIDVPPPNPPAPNQPPVANNANAIVAPSDTVAIAGLGGTDPDGTIAFFTVTTVPPAAQGTVFLGNPSAGGTTISTGQTLTLTQIGQIFFQSAAGFTGTNFTYSATDNRGAASPATATVAVLLPPPNLPPVVANVNLAVPPSSIAPIAGLGATDPDGSIASFTINPHSADAAGEFFISCEKCQLKNLDP